MAPVKGMRFYHKRVLDTMKFDGKSPQLYEVTRIGQGSVWYRPVIDYGTREELGNAERCLQENFSRVFGSAA